MPIEFVATEKFSYSLNRMIPCRTLGCCDWYSLAFPSTPRNHFGYC